MDTIEKMKLKKYYTDREFNQNGIFYAFTLYASLQDAHDEKNAQEVMIWNNNDLTRYEAQLVLMGILSGASCKYKQPKATLYAIDRDGQKTCLSSCI